MSSVNLNSPSQVQYKKGHDHHKPGVGGQNSSTASQSTNPFKAASASKINGTTPQVASAGSTSATSQASSIFAGNSGLGVTGSSHSTSIFGHSNNKNKPSSLPDGTNQIGIG